MRSLGTLGHRFVVNFLSLLRGALPSENIDRKPCIHQPSRVFWPDAKKFRRERASHRWKKKEEDKFPAGDPAENSLSRKS
jgi:hypothetical protein